MKRILSRLIIPMAIALLAIPVPAWGQDAGSQAALMLKTVVIDPGHGGKDPGCVSRDNKTFEKDIVLDIAQRLAGKISTAYPEVTVKMTRTKDNFVELENRASFANKANADLFISIHVNAAPKGTSANGYSIHCLGQSSRKGNDLFSKNLDLVKRENSVIKLEDNYETTYQGFDPGDPQSSIIFSLMQNAHLGSSLTFADYVAKSMGNSPIHNNRGVSQDPFWVLWRTAMPSVLIEVGFITNPDDLATMRSEKGRDQIAANIFRAFSLFKSGYDGSTTREAPAAAPVESPAPAPEVVKAEEAQGVLFGTQILVLSRELPATDPAFHGYTPLRLLTGGLYKYIIGTSSSLTEAKKKYTDIVKYYPDAYLVKVADGKTSVVR
jgi:N-acetylmuramoyl-L-alanine amidase